MSNTDDLRGAVIEMNVAVGLEVNNVQTYFPGSLGFFFNYCSGVGRIPQAN